MSEYFELIKRNNKGIFIIIQDECDNSDKLINLFNIIEVEYKHYKYIETDEIDETLPFKTEMKNTTNEKSFPFCYFNGKYMGGYNQICQNLISGGLKEKISELGIYSEE
tara:strand:- start:3726 stop:4052 length:327 start_codon:yes stop_codon:yes gene_type:complete